MGDFLKYTTYLKEELMHCCCFFFNSVSKCFQNNGGVIVNITAMLHQRGTALQLHAGSAKAAIG